jgi:hypothetical protein
LKIGKRRLFKASWKQYPAESYKWHLNYKDWEGVMERSADIYTTGENIQMTKRVDKWSEEEQRRYIIDLILRRDLVA